MLASLRVLKAFVVLAEELHFGRAAERLHISQPPLSQQIRQLEASLGVELFVRSTRQVRLTAAGRELLARARQLLQDAADTEQAVQRAAHGQVGTLRIGFTSSAAFSLLPRAIAAFREGHPGVGLVFKEMHSRELVEALHADRVDVALLRPAAAEQADQALAFTGILTEAMLLALPASHRFASLASVPVDALAGQPFIGYGADDGRYFHELVLRVFAEAAVMPEMTYESVLPTILALVEGGMGLALVPASASRFAGGRLAYRPLSGTASAPLAEMYGATRRVDVPPTAAAFLETVRGLPREDTAS